MMMPFTGNHVRQRAKKFREITKGIFWVSDHFLFTSMVLMMVNKIIDLCECCRSSNGLYRYRRWRGFWDAIWDSEVSITDFGCRDENLTLCDSLNQKVKHGD
jgi:hypothetical protein